MDDVINLWYLLWMMWSNCCISGVTVRWQEQEGWTTRLFWWSVYIYMILLTFACGQQYHSLLRWKSFKTEFLKTFKLLLFVRNLPWMEKINKIKINKLDYQISGTRPKQTLTFACSQKYHCLLQLKSFKTEFLKMFKLLLFVRTLPWKNKTNKTLTASF